jgi:acyl dehydratase
VSKGIRYEFAFGTYEDALRMVGTRTEPRYAGTAVSGARIQHFASMVHDANPAYWDVDFASETWGGGLVAPPAMLMGWLIPPPWLPTELPPTPSIAIRVPLPGTTFVNASNDVEFPETIVEGDHLHVVEEVVSVSPEKRTRLGAGHFIETCDQFHRADGTLVAINRNTLFRFTPENES